MQQGESTEDSALPAEGAAVPAVVTPLAPYVPLMATDAVADAAAALILDDVVPVQEESIVVVESISSNAGRPQAISSPCLAVFYSSLNQIYRLLYDLAPAYSCADVRGCA